MFTVDALAQWTEKRVIRQVFACSRWTIVQQDQRDESSLVCCERRAKMENKIQVYTTRSEFFRVPNDSVKMGEAANVDRGRMAKIKRQTGWPS